MNLLLALSAMHLRTIHHELLDFYVDLAIHLHWRALRGFQGVIRKHIKIEHSILVPVLVTTRHVVFDRNSSPYNKAHTCGHMRADFASIPRSPATSSMSWNSSRSLALRGCSAIPSSLTGHRQVTFGGPVGI